MSHKPLVSILGTTEPGILSSVRRIDRPNDRRRNPLHVCAPARSPRAIHSEGGVGTDQSSDAGEIREAGVRYLQVSFQKYGIRSVYVKLNHYVKKIKLKNGL